MEIIKYGNLSVFELGVVESIAISNECYQVAMLIIYSAK
jgi:hypothetical protein